MRRGIMGKYQIIYTSCKRGISGFSEGLQVFSHSPRIPGKLSDYVKGLLTYQAPSRVHGHRENSVRMPQAFMFRRMPNSVYGVVLKSYLNRDHTGRLTANYISHALIVDELKCYPAELYGSGMWQENIDQEDVNNSNVPPLLPVPVITRGRYLSLENVKDFLDDSRVWVFKKMLASLLCFNATGKRVVVCDTPENIIMWISALHYTLPMHIAQEVSFSTYEYDPSRSYCRICGAVPIGTAYNPDENNFTFDLFKNHIPDVEADGSFFDFVCEGLTISCADLHDFHNFVCEKLTYDNADSNYINAYALYCMLRDGIETISFDLFKSAMKIANTHAYKDTHVAILEEILQKGDFVLAVNDWYTLEIFATIFSMYTLVGASTHDRIISLAAKKIIACFISESTTKGSFLEIYEQLISMCESHDISIPVVLMQDANIKVLAKHLTNAQWQWDFIVEVCCDYVIYQNIPVEYLSLDHKIGRLLGDIVAARLTTDQNQGFILITRIIARFAYDWSYIANVALNLEGIILDTPNNQDLYKKHWAYVYDMFVSRQHYNRKNIVTLFLSHDRTDQAFDIYKMCMTSTDNVKVARELFYEQLEINDKTYLQTYMLPIFKYYYDFLIDKNEFFAKKELMELIARDNINVDFMPELIEDVLLGIPFGAISAQNEKFINNMLDYLRMHKDKGLPKRLILLVSGMLLDQINNSHELKSTIKTIKQLAKSHKIIGVDDSYITWVIPPIFKHCTTLDELRVCYDIYEHTEDITSDFILACAWEVVKSKDKDFNKVMMLLGFLFVIGNGDHRLAVGNIFRKFSKQRLEAVGEAVEARYKGDVKNLYFWSEVYEAATKPNSLLAGLGSLFLKKK